MAAQLEGLKHEQLLFVDETLKHLGSALAVSAAKTREPTLPSGHTIVQYFTSFMEVTIQQLQVDKLVCRHIIFASIYPPPASCYVPGSLVW